MHSLVRSAALEIERNLLIDRSHCQQSLFESFMRVDSRSRGAVLAVGSAVLIANATAQNLLTAAEQAHVQEYAKYVMGRQERTVDQIELGSGKVVKIRGTRILAGSDIAGMVVEVALVSESLPALTSASLTSAVPTGGPELPTASPVIREPSLVSDSGQSAVWKRACSDISAALSEHRPLLVMGETGTGKLSLVAEIYHRVNPGGRSLLMDAGGISRHSYPDADIAVQATTLPTLYIFRNIDQLSTDGLEELNTFLLMLADSDRDVYIAATLSDASIDSDLPFRDLLAHFQQAVTVPPLRHRTEDLPAVVARILAKISPGRRTTVGPSAMRLISRYSWPRNISQLEEALAAALVRRPVGVILPEDLPGYCNDSARRRLSGIEALERDAIVAALRDADGNRVQAAATLGIARSSLYRKLKCYGITTI